MKTWWIVALGLAVGSVAHAEAPGNPVVLKNAQGKTIAQAVMCNSCEKPDKGDTSCYEGAAEGWFDGKPCGSCLLHSNWGVLIRHSRDLLITGRLVFDDGTPAAKHYLKVFLPNGWGGRTQTNAEGHYNLRMGATAEREKGDPVVLDLGDRVDRKEPGQEQFSIYLLPDAFTPCAEAAKNP